MRKYLTLIYVLLFLIGATALWYFGHHRPAQRILKTEPKTVYKTTSLQPNDLSVKPIPSNPIHESREGGANTEVKGINTEMENTSNVTVPEAIDNKDRGEEADAAQLASQEDLSTEAAAADAFEKYFTAESEYQAEKEKFKKALEFGDSGQLESATKTLKETRLRRNEALENLAVYSEDAAEILAQVKENEKRADKVAAAFEDDYDAGMQELLAEYPFLRDMLVEHDYLPSE